MTDSQILLRETLDASAPPIAKSSQPPIADSSTQHLVRFPRLLLVRLRQIGDVVFTTPAVKAIRERFPAAHIAYVVEPAAEAVVAQNPHIDDVIVAPRHRGAAAWRAEVALVRRLRASAFDIAIDFHGGPRASLLTWLSGAPIRVGYEVVGRAWMYTTRVARPRELRARHSVRNQWDLLAALGMAPPSPDAQPVEMPIDRGAAARVTTRLAHAGVVDADCLIIVHVSAGNPFRRWPIPSFARVAARLVTRHALRRVIITSGPSEQSAAARVIADARAQLNEVDRDRVLDCGEFSLSELRALADRAALYIGGDSGPLHIASTSRVPIVGLYGPTLPARSAPWRPLHYVAEAVEVGALPCRPCDQRACIPGDFRCLTRIDPDEVVAAAERSLERQHVIGH